ncbi:ankyrin-1-like isoform X2 [Contarinia nasturtii]|uniref:ankyrin-1-like isoform X2 n=1 Tax=Contarinia nasturtii TaxID=265458 RepID=UPI0012D37845|nr:ankyrin-1-like isoform X2 [Contarinia nasturtii]
MKAIYLFILFILCFEVHAISNLDQQLINAAKNGYTDRVKTLIKNGANVNFRDVENDTPLLWAAHNGHIETIKVLLENGANIFDRNKANETSHDLAVRESKTEAANLLLEMKNFISVLISLPEFNIGETIRLPCSAYKNVIHTPITVAWRKANGSLPDRSYQKNGVLIITNVQCADSGVYVCKAEYEGNMKEERTTITIKELFSLVPYNRSNQTESQEPWQAFHSAVESGNLGTIEELLQKGTDINITDHNGRTPLFTAAQNGRHLIVEFLINNGADINLKDYYGEAPIHTATSEGHKRVVEILIKNGANTNIKDDNRRAPINIATQKDYERIAELLLKNGANANNQDKDGVTALFTAASFGRDRLVQMLLEHGANVNLPNNRGETPLYSATTAGFDDIVALFIQNGADVNKQDQNGWSPLHVATHNGLLKMVELLLKHEADANLKNQNNDTVIDLAIRKGNEKIIKLLKKRPAEKACANYLKNHSLHGLNITSLKSRILGGGEADSQEFPWMAALGYLNNNYQITFDCGGTIISNYFIVTAAHCVVESRQPIFIRLGKITMTDNNNIEPVNYRIADIIRHSNYSGLTKKNDIALIRVAKPILFTDYIMPACLELDSNDMDIDIPLIVTGWGSTADGLNRSDILLKAQLKTTPLFECNQTMLKWNEEPNQAAFRDGISHGQYCASDPQGRNDSCRGDSGGPLQYISETFGATVVGIVSSSVGCGTILPGIYTRIAYYLDWIEPIVWPAL